MKIVSILVILAVFYKHSEGLTCKTTSSWDSAFDLEDKDCTGSTECARPKRTTSGYAAAADGIAWGCGADCTVATSCLSCEGDGCNVEPTFKCRTDASNADQVSVCPDKTVDQDGEEVLVVESECKRSLYDGTNFGSGAWGCGGCAENAPDCVACTGAADDGSPCNNVAAGVTHTCRQYVKTNEVFSENTAAKDECQENTPGCRMPTPDNAAATWNACGKDCTSGDQTTGICRACDGENCNDQTSVEYCKTGAHNAEALVSNFCADEDSKCQRPFNTYGTLATTINYECGDCEDGADTDTCKVCEGSDCNTPLGDVDTHKCFQYAFENNKWVAKAQEQCQAGDAAQKCNMPAKDAETPAADDVSKKGCGPCVAAAEKCTTTDAEKNVETTHKCHTWDWNDADGKKTWEFTKDAVDCYTADTATKCSLPKDRSKKDGFVGNGCTACGTDDANCMTTEKEENSGRRVIFSLLALALPIFYALL